LHVSLDIEMHSASDSTCNITVTHLLKTQDPVSLISRQTEKLDHDCFAAEK